MSLFLGKIHYWLYNKIQMNERIEEEIIEHVKNKDSGIDDLVKHLHNEFGAPIGKKMLEDIIDSTNIHGWLQERIANAELRQAALITQVYQWSSSYKIEVLKIYTEHGENAALSYEKPVDSPEEIFNAINDFILEGMPCDRVNNVIESNNNEFSWETSMCLHKSYWDRVGGDVRNFYELREAWIKAFVKTINSEFKYEKSESGLNKIIRQK